MYGPRSSALELDAADGVIDGRYYGAPIVGANYRGQTHPMVAARSQQEALALDAADGVIDGNYFGSRVGVAAGTEARRIALREPVCIVPNQHTASSLDGKGVFISYAMLHATKARVHVRNIGWSGFGTTKVVASGGKEADEAPFRSALCFPTGSREALMGCNGGGLWRDALGFPPCVLHVPS